MGTDVKLERYLRLFFFASTALPAVAAAQARDRAVSAVVRGGTLSFLGRATVGDFVGTTTAVTGVVGGDFPNVRGWVEAPVASLGTRNAKRDHDLRASMEVTRYPTMRFDLLGVTVTRPAAASGDAIAVRLEGNLVIHGVARVVELPAMISRSADTIHVRSTFPLDLADYRIGGLTRMFGLLRMERQIEVRVDLRFVGGSEAAPR